MVTKNTSGPVRAGTTMTDAKVSNIPILPRETLTVTAETAWEIQNGSEQPLDPFVIVRVKDENGDPVTGLKETNFRVVEMGWGYKKVDLQVTSEWTEPPFQEIFDGLVLRGTYSLRMNRSLLDRYGQLVFAVVVTGPGPAVGQALLGVVKLK